MFSVILIDPKFPHNVGQALRASSCYGVKDLIMTGSRVSLDGDGKRYRLPREERLRGEYGAVVPSERPFDLCREMTPVAMELVPGAEELTDFDHPENAVYVFGPEDGTLSRGVLGQCHRFVRIPSASCLNLASALAVTLYDRHAKRVRAGQEESISLGEVFA